MLTYTLRALVILLIPTLVNAADVPANGTFDAGSGNAPEGWFRGGTDPDGCIWSIAGGTANSRCIKINDTSPKTYVNWVSATTALPAAAKELSLSWLWKHDITGGHFRVSITFFKPDGTSAGGGVHAFATGQQAEWAKQQIKATVPDGATHFVLEFVSGGAMETQGTMSIEDVIVAPAGK